MASKVGSQAWFDRASQDTIISHYKNTCKSYGLAEGSIQMANCIQKEIHEGKKQARNRQMDAFWMFKSIGIKLVDFKIEFGRLNQNGKKKILLADEISPDTCRLWDVSSEKKLDKDRFRKDLGNIIQAYQEVARRLGIMHEGYNISEVKFGKPKAVNIKKK